MIWLDPEVEEVVVAVEEVVAPEGALTVETPAPAALVVDAEAAVVEVAAEEETGRETRETDEPEIAP